MTTLLIGDLARLIERYTQRFGTHRWCALFYDRVTSAVLLNELFAVLLAAKWRQNDVLLIEAFQKLRPRLDQCRVTLQIFVSPF